MSKIPPEKYYEACITYNLVYEFNIKYDIKLYPFSISQIEEKEKGYDFGYELSNDSFFIQYKKPSLFDINTNKYSWKIDNEQLHIINRSNINIKTYYALPGFVNTSKWYEGLDLTYFIESVKLGNILKSKNGQKTATLHSTNNGLRSWSYYFDSKQNLRNLARCDILEPITLDAVKKYTLSIDEESKNITWLYAIRKGTKNEK
ncbi:MAG TPA: hypothetical protein GX523_02115 [Desulfitobacterium dehalogenans]|uniref:Uncharacterized protein n=1 Tax=Desulfitobacterium dehalogenans TaxID=36854 RepID=A0A7C6Z2J3_9FIRM|nr:hypothetical protein [Desulfitobacterium dehalogenans]